MDIKAKQTEFKVSKNPSKKVVKPRVNANPAPESDTDSQGTD